MNGRKYNTKEPSLCVSLCVLPLSAEGDDGDEVPGYIEYFFWAEYLHEDGHTSTEMISILVEDSSDSANQ